MPRSHADSQLPDRIIGTFGDNEPEGPLVIALGSMHGNEPAGPVAIRRVLTTLERDRPKFWGQFVAMLGNRRAVAQRQRYLERDLNRMFTADRIALMLAGEEPDPHHTPEHDEMRELLEVLGELFGGAENRPVRVLDFHTSSADGAPFGLFPDAPGQLSFAVNFPAPLLLRLDAYLKGVLICGVGESLAAEFSNYRGFAFESGQHDAPIAVDYAEAALWIALAASGCIADDTPVVVAGQQALIAARGELPHLLEVCHRHPIEPLDHFGMAPGMLNFDVIHEGQRLASDNSGDIVSPLDGRLIMPLYQGQGEDGFFLAREVAVADHLR